MNNDNPDIIITAAPGELILTAQNANGDGWLGLKGFAPAAPGTFTLALDSFTAPADEAAAVKLCAGWDGVAVKVEIPREAK